MKILGVLPTCDEAANVTNLTLTSSVAETGISASKLLSLTMLRPIRWRLGHLN